MLRQAGSKLLSATIAITGSCNLVCWKVSQEAAAGYVLSREMLTHLLLALLASTHEVAAELHPLAALSLGFNWGVAPLAIKCFSYPLLVLRAAESQGSSSVQNGRKVSCPDGLQVRCLRQRALLNHAVMLSG